MKNIGSGIIFSINMKNIILSVRVRSWGRRIIIKKINNKKRTSLHNEINNAKSTFNSFPTLSFRIHN